MSGFAGNMQTPLQTSRHMPCVMDTLRNQWGAYVQPQVGLQSYSGWLSIIVHTWVFNFTTLPHPLPPWSSLGLGFIMCLLAKPRQVCLGQCDNPLSFRTCVLTSRCVHTSSAGWQGVKPWGCPYFELLPFWGHIPCSLRSIWAAEAQISSLLLCCGCCWLLWLLFKACNTLLMNTIL